MDFSMHSEWKERNKEERKRELILTDLHDGVMILKHMKWCIYFFHLFILAAYGNVQETGIRFRKTHQGILLDLTKQYLQLFGEVEIVMWKLFKN